MLTYISSNTVENCAMIYQWAMTHRLKNTDIE